MKIIGVIPARFGSTRFPGKPLKLIAGRPLIAHVIEGAKQCKKLSRLIVATDHEDIAKAARSLEVEVAMTDSNLPSGSDRVWAAAKNVDCDVILNIQGDEPLIYDTPLNQLCEAFKDKTVKMATLAREFPSIEEFQSPQIAKIVVNKNNDALYFSRLPIPHTRESAKEGHFACLKHIGLYGYTKSFLESFCSQKPTEIENAEALEQLRALWMGVPIRVILTNFVSWGVDTPEDVVKVEKMLAQRSK